MSVKQKKKPNVKFAPIKQVAALSEKNSNPRRERKVDNSPYIYQDKKVGLNFDLKCNVPWTEKQVELLNLIEDKTTKVIFLSAPAGVGKTLLAVYAGLLGLSEKKFSQIMYFRSAVESSSSKLGMLPGTVEDKISAYLEPVLVKLDQIVGKENANNMVQKGLVSGQPINYLRGCEFASKFVIGDEFQNCTEKEILTFLSRIAEFSKIIICGDPQQADIKNSGFKKYFDLFNDEESKENGIHTFEFGEEDIKRSKVLRFIVKKTKEL